MKIRLMKCWRIINDHGLWWWIIIVFFFVRGKEADILVGFGLLLWRLTVHRIIESELDVKYIKRKMDRVDNSIDASRATINRLQDEVDTTLHEPKQRKSWRPKKEALTVWKYLTSSIERDGDEHTYIYKADIYNAANNIIMHNYQNKLNTSNLHFKQSLDSARQSINKYIGCDLPAMCKSLHKEFIKDDCMTIRFVAFKAVDHLLKKHNQHLSYIDLHHLYTTLRDEELYLQSLFTGFNNYTGESPRIRRRELPLYVRSKINPTILVSVSNAKEYIKEAILESLYNHTAFDLYQSATTFHDDEVAPYKICADYLPPDYDRNIHDWGVCFKTFILDFPGDDYPSLCFDLSEDMESGEGKLINDANCDLRNLIIANKLLGNVDCIDICEPNIDEMHNIYQNLWQNGYRPLFTKDFRELMQPLLVYCSS